MQLHVTIVPVVGQYLVTIRTEVPHRGPLPTLYSTIWQGVCQPMEGHEHLPEVEGLLEAAIGSTIGCLRERRGYGDDEAVSPFS
jgi:hypothetical protein